MLGGCSTPPAATGTESAPAAAAADSCPLQLVADLPITYIDGNPTIPVSIQGHQFNMIVDSGSDISYMSKHAYDVLNIHYSDHVEGGGVNGLGGTADIENYVLADLDFGGVHLHKQPFGVVAHYGAEEKSDGLIGYDILQLFEVGLDFPDRKITLYQRAQCQLTETPWVGDYAPVPYTRPQNTSPVIPVSIDNQTVQLAVDTGAFRTIVFQHSLDLLNVKPEASEQIKSNGHDLNGLKMTLARAEFNTITIGAESIPDDWIILDETPNAEFNAINDGLLGRDYLSTHRVFIANSSHTVYLGLTVPGS